MTSTDELRRDNAALRQRMSSLSAAFLRISASLDFSAVLEEILASACALTGARYGAITTIDESGQPECFVTSGLTEEEHRQMAEWPDGRQLFDLLRDLPGVLTQQEMPAYVRSFGPISDLIRPKTFQGTPMQHRGAQVGYFFLAKKEGGPEFKSEDEEMLVLFAAQAATAIANARTHRDEQQARADLEALINTSPIGVVVFSAGTGGIVRLNREAKRLVASLRAPDRTLEELLEVATYRRADGREIALRENPLAPELRKRETVRAEEIVFSVPDGRSVRILINATPIESEDGAVESVVVTMQDLAPFEELERSRAEFLGLVSHELRAPLTSIKGSTTTVLGRSSDMDPAEARQFFQIIDQQADHMDGLISDLLDAGRIDAGRLSVAPQPTDLASLVDRARNTFLSGGGRHVIHFDLPRDLPRVMADRRRFVQVLNNLLSNAAKHSPDSSPIRVAAVLDGTHVAISVADEGSGLPPDLLPRLFQKYSGLEGGDQERGIGGYGLGLAICKGLVEAHGGRIWAESGGLGQGTRLTFTIPVAEEAAGRPATDPARRRRSPSAQERRERPRILVVDDDPETLRYVRGALTEARYDPIVTGDPHEVSHLVKTRHPKLVLLDLILPGIDGIELMERLPELADLPVIFISGYGRDETIARALEKGAEDYIVKPFSPTELVARIRAALRRRTEPEPFLLEALAIDYEQRHVTVAGRQVRLTATEYNLLHALSANSGRVSTYDYLLRQVWSGRDTGNPKVVRAFIKRLRQRLGDDASKPTYIFNERGVGYRMPSPHES